MFKFLKNAFKDMKKSAQEQHKVDKANLEAVKAESKITWEEAKLSPKGRQNLMKAEREKQIAEANARKEAAEKRITEIKSYEEKSK